jgi:hypothetical protein
MQYLSSEYLVNQPLHVLGIFVAHHREVHCIYTTILLFLFFGLPVANAPDVPQPCGLLYYP